ncbi:hypothetical protein EIP91_001410 [Steccherinum ochraceum]|uniref:Transmembrane protein n=1 Tax=Steccherinum ochraceum TaxID=92696 RepID=A0A4R0RMK3_9APHY|nr:hypothetical protein EIP91_001410 [Steccherinum ochraceum]
MAASSWNFTLDDASPFLQYWPTSDDSYKTGWQALFDGVKDPLSAACGTLGVGNSTHVTSFNGATISFGFYGDAVSLYGGGNSSYSVSLDNVPATFQPPSDNVLFTKTGIPLGFHNITLTATPQTNQQLIFDQVLLSESLPSGLSPIPMTYDNSNSTLQYFGSWQVQSDPQVPDPTHIEPFHITSTAGSYVSLNFTGSVGVAVKSSRNCGEGAYNINLLDTSTQSSSVLNSNTTTRWFMGDTVLYYQAGLSPNSTYEIQVVNAWGNNFNLTLNDIVVYQASDFVSPPAQAPSQPEDLHAKVNRLTAGVIATSVIAALAILFIIAFMFWWRRQRKRTHDSRDITSVEKGRRSFVEPFPRGHLTVAEIVTNANTKSRRSTDSQTALSPATITPSTSSSLPSTRPSRSGTTGRQTNQATSPVTLAPLDVNHIVELVASRMDRPGQAPGDDTAPPAYPPSEFGGPSSAHPLTRLAVNGSVRTVGERSTPSTYTSPSTDSSAGSPPLAHAPHPLPPLPYPLPPPVPEKS